MATAIKPKNEDQKSESEIQTDIKPDQKEEGKIIHVMQNNEGKPGIVFREDEVIEPPKEEPKIEIPKMPEIIKAPYNKASDVTLPIEERIMAYLDGKSGTVKLNAFLKSLYPAKPPYPPEYLLLQTSRYLGHILEKMQSERKITIVNNQHHRLGDTYFPDAKTAKAEQYTLDTLTIEASC